MAVLPKVKSALCAASQLPGEGPTDKDMGLFMRKLDLHADNKCADKPAYPCLTSNFAISLLGKYKDTTRYM